MIFTLVAGLLATTSACSPAGGTERAPESAASVQATPAVAVPAAPALPPLTEEEKAFYRDAAKVAWTFLDAHYKPSTGFVSATAEWANTTLWDVGGEVLAMLSAKELGLITAAEFDTRTAKLLGTLERVPLFRDAAFNKLYSANDGSLAKERLGWSATDLGRILVALRVLAVREPKFAEQAARVVRRNDFKQIVKDGYLHGQIIGTSGKPWTFQEGRIGYEQYIARGFAQWGADVRKALSLKTNGKEVKVNGVTLMKDVRTQDRLLSEPFVLQGLELGFDDDMRKLAEAVLAVQEQRYRSTGTVTIASEDAVSIKPYYFYYYCVYCNGKAFVIDIDRPGNEQSSPRWVSTKATFGWHALMPSDYTKTAMDYVAAAKDPTKGWASGVFEGSGLSTKTYDVNTAAVILEVAAYQLRGRKPLIQPASEVEPAKPQPKGG